MSEVKRPRCSFCDREAIITIKYARLRLCKRHLEEFLIKRLKKVELPKRVLLGLSGGKDSVALLYLLKKVGTEVVAATVDTVPNYTSLEAELAKRVAEELGVTHYTVYAKELYGFTALSYKKLRRAPCSICSKLRRHALELLARRLGIEYIATGHNMDDMASWALSYILRGDFQSLKKVRPVERPKGPARGRVKPLFWIGEKEIMTFLLSKKLPWLKASCPLYEPRSTFVDYVKETILKLEERYGNVRINLLNYVVRREGGNEGEGEPNACKYCGGPAWGEVCSVCSLRRKVGKLDERPLEPRPKLLAMETC